MNVEIDMDYFAALSKVEDSLTRLDRDLLIALCLAPGNEAAAGALAPLVGQKSHAPLNIAIARLGRALAEAVDLDPPRRDDGSVRWWQVVATGRDGTPGTFLWKLRPGLRDAAYRCGLVPLDSDLFPEVVSTEEVLTEGAVTRVTVNAYERHPVARRRCIEHYGAGCLVCGFNFGETYGAIAAGIIHVHHLRPVSYAQGEEYAIDPIRDLRPVCANCHLVIHRRNPPFTIEEATALLQRSMSK